MKFLCSLVLSAVLSSQAAAQPAGEFRAKYPDWAQPLRVVAAANAIYAELP